jgi:hypothetical protein
MDIWLLINKITHKGAMRKLLFILLILFCFVEAWAEVPHKKPFSLDGASGGNVTSDLAVTGDISATNDITAVNDITASGDMTGANILTDGVVYFPPTTCAGLSEGQLAYDGTRFCFQEAINNTDIIDQTAGTGYFSPAGTDIYRPSGNVGIGEDPTAFNKVYIKLTDSAGLLNVTDRTLLLGSGEAASYYGKHVTVTGSGDAAVDGTCVAVYADASGCNTNYGIHVAVGDLKVVEDIHVGGAVISDAADGTHYINCVNTTFSDNTDEGSFCYNDTTDEMPVYNGANWTTNFMPIIVTAATAPATCTAGRDFYVDTTATISFCFCKATDTWEKLNSDGAGCT